MFYLFFLTWLNYKYAGSIVYKINVNIDKPYLGHHFHFLSIYLEWKDVFYQVYMDETGLMFNSTTINLRQKSCLADYQHSWLYLSCSSGLYMYLVQSYKCYNNKTDIILTRLAGSSHQREYNICRNCCGLVLCDEMLIGNM